MKQEVIRELSTPELMERLEDERIQLSRLKMNHAISPLENPNKIKAYRKTVARLTTEVTRRQNEAAGATKPNNK
ncbi:MAG: 50S ribosomal protein L29 [Bacteroidales bacterium]|nr:50S ribosomal protein L29 [Bacteroidales bacterium]MBK7173532.1 50S ribosomal protein L29 [Bacteroidales bacterium]